MSTITNIDSFDNNHNLPQLARTFYDVVRASNKSLPTSPFSVFKLAEYEINRLENDFNVILGVNYTSAVFHTIEIYHFGCIDVSVDALIYSMLSRILNIHTNIYTVFRSVAKKLFNFFIQLENLDTWFLHFIKFKIDETLVFEIIINNLEYYFNFREVNDNNVTLLNFDTIIEQFITTTLRRHPIYLLEYTSTQFKVNNTFDTFPAARLQDELPNNIQNPFQNIIYPDNLRNEIEHLFQDNNRIENNIREYIHSLLPNNALDRFPNIIPDNSPRNLDRFPNVFIQPNIIPDNSPRNLPHSSNISSISGVQSESNDNSESNGIISQKCCICLDADKCFVIITCGHVPFCAPCKQQYCLNGNYECPVCRRAHLLSDVRRIYL